MLLCLHMAFYFMSTTTSYCKVTITYFTVSVGRTSPTCHVVACPLWLPFTGSFFFGAGPVLLDPLVDSAFACKGGMHRFPNKLHTLIIDVCMGGVTGVLESCNQPLPPENPGQLKEDLDSGTIR